MIEECQLKQADPLLQRIEGVVHLIGMLGGSNTFDQYAVPAQVILVVENAALRLPVDLRICPPAFKHRNRVGPIFDYIPSIEGYL